MHEESTGAGAPAPPQPASTSSVGARWLPRWSLLLDLAVVVLLLAIRVASWRAGEPEPPVPGYEELPRVWWLIGGVGDTVLTGDDCGTWAENTRTLLSGGVPDWRRLPLYHLLTGGVFLLVRDLVFAGHIANKLAACAAVMLTYALGRGVTRRPGAIAAAVLVALSPTLVMFQNLYTVDVSVTLMVLATVLAMLWWCGKEGATPWLPALVVGLFLATHYLSVLFLASLLPLLLWCRGAWRPRLRDLIILAVGALVVFELLAIPYGFIRPWQVLHQYFSGSAGRFEVDLRALSGFELALLTVQRLPQALLQACRELPSFFEARGLPAAALVALILIGLAGSPVTWARGAQARATFWRGSAALAAGLPLLVMLQVGEGDARYAQHAIPLVFLLVARGTVELGRAVERPLHRWLPPVTRGLVPALLCLALVLPLAGPFRAGWSAPPRGHDQLARSLGAYVVGNQPGVATLARVTDDVRFFAERQACAIDLPCVHSLGSCGDAVARCLGLGDLIYVVREPALTGPGDPPTDAMDRWVRERGELVWEGHDRDHRMLAYLVSQDQRGELGLRGSRRGKADHAAPPPREVPPPDDASR
jgi:hypothetical protein